MNNRCHSTVFNFVLRLVVLIQFSAGSLASNQLSTTAVAIQVHSHDQFTLNDRMSEIEAKSQRQEKDIGLLKTQRAEDRKVINQLRGRVEQLETLTGTGNILSRQKRPFRLAPANLNR